MTDRQGRGLLTESSVLDLLLRLAEDGKQLDHNLCDYFRHQSAQRNLSIDFKAFEEAPNTLKEFKESIVARADPLCRLI